MSRYAVVGDPIAHSKSPKIHALFAAQTGEPVEYVAQQVSSDNFEQFVGDFFAGGGAGLNITLPHKQAAFAMCEQVSTRASLAGAVNTLYLENGKLCGDNTDGPGLVRDIVHNHGFPLTDKTVLVLGAGGAARGVLASLVEQQTRSITLLNRTAAKAHAIRDAFAEVASIHTGDYTCVDPGQTFDLIINATSLSLEQQLPPVKNGWVSETSCCYDLMYADRATVFMEWGRTCGAAVVLDGLGMLVEQAAESFMIWRGVRPLTEDVIRVLRS